MRPYRSLVQLIIAGAFSVTSCFYLDARPYKTEYASLRSPSWSRSVQSPSIPLELYGNRIYLAVSVNGSGPFRFILDTGASLSVINQARSVELGLNVKYTGQEISAGAGENKTRAYQARNVSFALPGVSLSLREILALPMSDVESRLRGSDLRRAGLD